jgi:hypothetical protein
VSAGFGSQAVSGPADRFDDPLAELAAQVSDVDVDEVGVRVHAESLGWRFEVADDGGGLPPGEEQVVFEPFRTGSSPSGRTGLGLSIARGIARAHGGECGVMNRPGQGATFWIRIRCDAAGRRGRTAHRRIPGEATAARGYDVERASAGRDGRGLHRLPVHVAG